MNKKTKNAMLGTLFVITVLTFTVNGFNLENRLPIYKFDTRTNSYFGYSVAIHHELGENGESKKW